MTNTLLIENAILLASVAPGKFYETAVVCFPDSCYLILKKISSTFRVDADPTAMYGFGEDSVEDGLKKIIESSSNEADLKDTLLELIGNNQTCVINFSDYKKTRIKGFLGKKTFSARKNALNYISFSIVSKEEGKKITEFYNF
jgi:hypothetical protein